MRNPRSYLVLATAASLVCIAIGAADDDPVDESNWLIEKAWPAFVASKRLEVAGTDDKLTKLLKQRFNAGQQELRNRYSYWLQGTESLPQVYDAVRRVVEARRETNGPGSDRIEILKEKLAFARIVEKQAEKLSMKFRRASYQSGLDCATYFRATAEVELLRAEEPAPEK
jgi:hypothetical protein